MVGIKIVSTYLIYMAFCSMVLKANRCGRANSIYGKMLHGSVFKELSINTPYLCQQICDTETICQSFNYNVNRQICELNSRTKEASPNDFVPDQERLYMTRHKNRGKEIILRFENLKYHVWSKKVFGKINSLT